VHSFYKSPTGCPQKKEASAPTKKRGVKRGEKIDEI
jgi:hypothetical protein